MRASKQPTVADARRMLVEIEGRVARGKLGVTERPRRLSIGQLLARFFAEYDPPRAKSRTAWEQKARSQLATLIEDGSCLGWSIGPMFDALGRHLTGKRDLGLHSLMLTDAVMDLIKSGAVSSGARASSS